MNHLTAVVIVFLLFSCASDSSEKPNHNKPLVSQKKVLQSKEESVPESFANLKGTELISNETLELVLPTTDGHLTQERRFGERRIQCKFTPKEGLGTMTFVINYNHAGWETNHDKFSQLGFYEKIDLEDADGAYWNPEKKRLEFWKGNVSVSLNSPIHQNSLLEKGLIRRDALRVAKEIISNL